MAKAISLDDLDEVKKKKKKKVKISASSSAKPAKSASKVPLSTAKKAKVKSKSKKQKKGVDLSTDGIDPNAIFEDLPAPIVTTPATIDSSTQAGALEGELYQVLQNVPDSVKRENAQFQEYLNMFDACQRMARAIEERFEERKSPRDVYPLMKLYEQMREIIADLRAIKDVTELGEVVNDEVIAPLVQNVTTILIGYHQTVLSWINANCTNEQIANAQHHFKQQLPKSAKDIESAYHASLDKTMQIFAQEQ